MPHKKPITTRTLHLDFTALNRVIDEITKKIEKRSRKVAGQPLVTDPVSVADPLRVAGQIRTNTYAVFSRAVEEGVEYGWNRAHKHTSTPDADVVKEEIEQAIMNSVCEFFSFDSPEL